MCLRLMCLMTRRRLPHQTHQTPWSNAVVAPSAWLGASQCVTCLLSAPFYLVSWRRSPPCSNCIQQPGVATNLFPPACSCFVACAHFGDVCVVCVRVLHKYSKHMGTACAKRVVKRGGTQKKLIKKISVVACFSRFEKAHSSLAFCPYV